jgi:hypothetical protein
MTTHAINFDLFHRNHALADELDMWFFAEHASTRGGIGDLLLTSAAVCARMAINTSGDESQDWSNAAKIMCDALSRLKLANLEKLGAE